MDKQKMLEQFRQKYDNPYYEWKNFTHVLDYIEGKTDQLDEDLLKGKKSYVWYDEWMIKALYGNEEDSIETAKRILLIISRIRRDGLISGSYRVVEDAKMLLLIGYDFQTLVKQSVVKFRDISTTDLAKLAALFIDYKLQESVEMADRLLTDEVEKLIEQRKATREIYLALYLAVELMLKDSETYSRYLPVILSLSERLGGNYIIQLLYQAYSLSPSLKEKLRQELATNTKAASIVLDNTGEEMIPFLDKIEAVRWSYYYCLMKGFNYNHTINRQEVFSKLYEEDKETFTQLYQRLASSNSSDDYMYVPYMLAILLKNGEGREEVEKSGTLWLGMLKYLLSSYTEKDYNNLSQMVDEKVSLKEALSEPIRYQRAFSWGVSEHILTGFALLYDYSSRVRRIIHLLLEHINLSAKNHHNPDYVIFYFLKARKEWLAIEPEKSLHVLFDSEADYQVEDAFATYCFAFTMWGDDYQHLMAEAVNPGFIQQYKEKALELLTSGKLDIEETLVWLNLIYEVSGFKEYKPLIDLLGHKSKKLRKKAEELIGAIESDVRPMLEERFPNMKGDVLAATKRLIKKWDNDRKYGADFAFTDSKMLVEFCMDNYDKDNHKFISWIPEDFLKEVRFLDMNEKAPQVVMEYLLSEYLSLEEPYRIKVCDKVVAMLHRPDLQAALLNIYQYWKDNGAEAKKKMLMVPYCIYASDTQILALRTQLKDWAEASRGALAAFVVNAIALNGGSVALMMIDGLGTKFPNSQVKNAAKAAFAFAAKMLEVPEDVLSDRIVPTLGFNKEGEKILDYGSRTFTVTLLPDFSLSVFDNDKQKKIKSMPSPGANDDQIKATAAKKEFSEIKKQIKATVQTQTDRLEKVLMNGRRWKAEAWNELFVENPIMHRFATSLIWGAYKGDVLEETFRYMEDGTFNTVDENEYALPEDVTITLVHPCELTEENLEQWKEQLNDYEVIQPLPQLTMSVSELKPEEISNKKIIRYVGTSTESGKIAGLAKKYNMVRGDVLDGGSYVCFHWVDKFLNMAAQLNFEYMWMGQEYNESVSLGEVIFYRLTEDGDVLEEPGTNLILDPVEVPQRFVCSVMGVFDRLKQEN